MGIAWRSCGDRLEIAGALSGGCSGAGRAAGDSREEAGCQVSRERWRVERGRASELAEINGHVGCFEPRFIQADVRVRALSVGDAIGPNHGVCLVGFKRCGKRRNVVGILIVACEPIK